MIKKTTALETINQIEEAVWEVIKTCGGKPESIPSDLARAHSTRPGRPVCIETKLWSSDAYHALRLAVIKGDENNGIINFGAYPHPHADAPVLQVEILIFGGKAFLALLDCDTLDTSSERCLPALKKLEDLRSMGEFPQSTDRPDWSHEVFSPHAFWTKPKSETPLELLTAGVLGFLEVASSSLRNLDYLQNAVVHHRREESLKKSRRLMLKYEPSRVYFHANFGVVWTERYFEEVLFPPLKNQTEIVPRVPVQYQRSY